MATLEELLALLPDNDTGAIDAADLRQIVTSLWVRETGLEARIGALEAAATNGDSISITGTWNVNPMPGEAPQEAQITADAAQFHEATWLRLWKFDVGYRDMTMFLRTATRLYGQQSANAENWAYFDITGFTDMGFYVELQVTLRSYSGTSTAVAWQESTIVLSMPNEEA